MEALNISALVQLCHHFVPPMVARGYGGVINIGSVLGLTFLPGMAVYAGTKYFVTGFSESLRTELSGTGVRVTLVCPGPVESEFFELAGTTLRETQPPLLTIGADQCARETIRGFRRGKGACYPRWYHASSRCPFTSDASTYSASPVRSVCASTARSGIQTDLIPDSFDYDRLRYAVLFGQKPPHSATRLLRGLFRKRLA